MLNNVTIMGRLAKDPELRTTQSGLAVTRFSLAVDRDFKDKSTGERTTDWIDVVAWRQTAEFVCKYFAKGRMAVVSGRLQVRDYTDNQGNKRRATEVVADNVYFGDTKRDDSSGQYAGGQPAAAPGGYAQPATPVQSSLYGRQYSAAASAQTPAAPPLPDGYIAAEGDIPF